MSLVSRRSTATGFAVFSLVAGLLSAEPAVSPALSSTPSAVPLAAGPSAPASDFLVPRETARRALQLGLPTTTALLDQSLLERTDLSTEVRNELVIELTTALLDDNHVSEAAQALTQVPLTLPRARLRQGMIAAREKHFDQVRAALGAFKADELPPVDRGWYYFLQGMVSESTNDFSKANGHYQQAIESATNPIQAARFILAREQARLWLGETSETQIAQFHKTAEQFAGRSTGYRAISDWVIALNARGDRSGAMNVLSSQLQSLPRDQRQVADEWSLLMGLIAGPGETTGRVWLYKLLTNGVNREKQRVALQLLAKSSIDPTHREEFRDKLDELIALPKPHPLLEEVLIFRAELALGDGKEDTRAEDYATELLERFPGSQLKGLAYEILTDAAWERGQYRNAASLAAKAREQLPAGQARAELGVLVAEAYFRGSDFVSAADAYGAALNELPTSVTAGDVMFQQVISEIRAQHLDQAAKLEDDRARDPRFDAKNRWEAEWNLTRALQADGRVALAYKRLNAVLDSTTETASIPAELRARMRWLQARLSFDAGEPKRTLQLTEALLSSLEGLDPSLKADIASTTILLQVQANYALNADATSPQTMDLLKRLRTEYANNDAAVYSYIVQADAEGRTGHLVDAQNLLNELSVDYPKSPYAPYALYQAAEYAERRGQAANYEEANNLIENLVNKYPKDDLVFYARLKQGHLLRKLTYFSRAEQVYQNLDNNPQFAQHPGRAAVELALADTHAAQATQDPSHLEAAHRIYERLLDLATAPVPIKIEAGYKYGLSLSRHGRVDDALRVWGVVMNFLVRSNGDVASFGAQGEYWLSRTLLDYGALLQQEKKPAQAHEAYDLILKTGLPGAAIARDNLSRLQPVAPVTQ
jgi:outer membrane protein assembly factor BamD (BamD/ComL family)